MGRIIRTFALLLVGILLGSVTLLGQFQTASPTTASRVFFNGPGFGFSNNFFIPSFDFFPGYYSPYQAGGFYNPTPYPYLPNHWWVSQYPIADPRQEGYNPSAGYPKESVATLLLDTYPAKSRIVLDGIFVGTTDSLGPTQLPVGEHTLRVEAPGYEPSETILKVEQPVLEQLEIRLTPATHAAKPAPRS